ncbi:hypothetical protein J3Q64DRAFT_1130546 [Phycomyces blakesleeanus]|uniref:Radical SAM core domain-containing protein n=1 Tax=Phycomyces blakesleeanus TaxID=4837 RepID=A0ABR3AXH1_PHYBL
MRTLIKHNLHSFGIKTQCKSSSARFKKKSLVYFLFTYLFHSFSLATLHIHTAFSTLNTKLPAKTPFSIYIHWPYCESKCTYCNFNKYINPRDPPHERLVKAMTRELDFYLTDPRFGLKNKRLNSVYFGGGTPSLALVCNT